MDQLTKEDLKGWNVHPRERLKAVSNHCARGLHKECPQHGTIFTGMFEEEKTGWQIKCVCPCHNIVSRTEGRQRK